MKKRFLTVAQISGVLMLFASLATVLLTDKYRLQWQRQQTVSEVSVFHESLSSFSKPSKNELSLNSTSERQKYALPPLNSIIDEDGNIIGSPQVLLQFAVIGFGKCGTSSLMLWLEQHPQLQMLTSEVWALTAKDPARLIQRLHKKLTLDLPRGYKCPGDVLAQFVMDYYKLYWPKTKLFVGIRHPVLWFQSLYNFRVQNFDSFDGFPHPNLLIRHCGRKWTLMCSARGFFGFHLMRLGKHGHGGRPPSSLELQMLDWMGFAHNSTDSQRANPVPNDIFLFELSQLSDTNKTRHTQFKADIQSYLELSQPLPEMVHYTPGKEWHNALQAKRDAKKIDICNDQYIPLRCNLMRLSRLSSEWIRQEFLDIPSVHVSSRQYLQDILANDWMMDPCGDKSDRTSQDEIDRILLATTGRTEQGLNVTFASARWKRRQSRRINA
jgi:hypothetical protein